MGSGGGIYSPFVLKYSNNLASECSERDTLRVNTIENQGCLFVYVWTYICRFVF